MGLIEYKRMNIFALVMMTVGNVMAASVIGLISPMNHDDIF